MAARRMDVDCRRAAADNTAFAWMLPQMTTVRGNRIEISWGNQRMSPKQFHDIYLPWLSDNLSTKVHEARSTGQCGQYISCTLDISRNTELSSEPRVLKSLLALLAKHRVAPTILKLFRMDLDDKYITVLCDYMNSNMPKELPISELHLSHNQLTSDGAWRLLEVAFECGHYPPKSDNARTLWLRLEKNFTLTNQDQLLRKAAAIGLSIGTKEQPVDNCTVTMPHFFVSEGAAAGSGVPLPPKPIKGSKGKGKGKKASFTSQWADPSYSKGAGKGHHPLQQEWGSSSYDGSFETYETYETHSHSNTPSAYVCHKSGAAPPVTAAFTKCAMPPSTPTQLAQNYVKASTAHVVTTSWNKRPPKSPAHVPPPLPPPPPALLPPKLRTLALSSALPAPSPAAKMLESARAIAIAAKAARIAEPTKWAPTASASSTAGNSSAPAPKATQASTDSNDSGPAVPSTKARGATAQAKEPGSTVRPAPSAKSSIRSGRTAVPYRESAAPSVRTAVPSTKAAGPSSSTPAPSVKATGPSSRTAPSARTAGRSTRHAVPSTKAGISSSRAVSSKKDKRVSAYSNPDTSSRKDTCGDQYDLHMKRKDWKTESPVATKKSSMPCVSKTPGYSGQPGNREDPTSTVLKSVASPNASRKSLLNKLAASKSKHRASPVKEVVTDLEAEPDVTMIDDGPYAKSDHTAIPDKDVEHAVASAAYGNYGEKKPEPAKAKPSKMDAVEEYYASLLGSHSIEDVSNKCSDVASSVNAGPYEASQSRKVGAVGAATVPTSRTRARIKEDEPAYECPIGEVRAPDEEEPPSKRHRPATSPNRVVKSDTRQQPSSAPVAHSPATRNSPPSLKPSPRTDKHAARQKQPSASAPKIAVDHAKTQNQTDASSAKKSPRPLDRKTSQTTHAAHSNNRVSTDALLEAHYDGDPAYSGQSEQAPSASANPAASKPHGAAPIASDCLLDAHYAQKEDAPPNVADAAPASGDTNAMAPRSTCESFHLELLGL
eukprot:GEMP01004650.1.p1 GENE.GEMP01004650.1~~GEMP01004650.1.p1  ORF type:complete len:999 (+),score=268.00 GEMP01004650.1:35-3031(+)